MTRTRNVTSRHRRGLAVLGLLLAIGCSGSNSFTPSSDGLPAEEDSPAAAPIDSLAAPVDSTAVPADSTTVPPDSLPPIDSLAPGDSLTPDSTVISPLIGTAPGIAFAAMGMKAQYIGAPFNGSKYGVIPAWTMAELSTARSKGGRMILELASGSDDNIQNSDGTFSLTKWKAMVLAFKPLALGSYITDGTLMGHFLIDEPQNARKWGGKAIPHTTVEAMAQYSKQLWPSLPTFVRAAPTWLEKSPITYTYLDAAWTQYEAYFKGRPAMPEVNTWITAEVAAAKRKRLGLIVGLNILDGGNGSSGFRGWMTGNYAMSATEIRNYGTALLKQSYACGFFSWTYLYSGATYMAKPAIRSVLTELSNMAKAHVKTSCRQ